MRWMQSKLHDSQPYSIKFSSFVKCQVYARKVERYSSTLTRYLLLLFAQTELKDMFCYNLDHHKIVDSADETTPKIHLFANTSMYYKSYEFKMVSLGL